MGNRAHSFSNHQAGGRAVKAVTSKAVLLAAVLLSATWLCAGDKDKTAKLESKVVDSGSFGIYVGGKRIGTETFKIEHHPDFSVATAEIKDGNGALSVIGRDKVTLKGSVREMTKVSLELGEPQLLIMMNSSKEAPGQWFLWVEDQYKVIKIAVTDSNIEVIRD